MPNFTSLRVAIASLAFATLAAAQRPACAPVNAQPDFGYDGIECVNCEINGSRAPWIVFHTEPRIHHVRAGGPADGRLREGDTLTEIDGILITRRAAAEWYSRVPPGDTVVFTVKRDGSSLKVPIVTGKKCVTNQWISGANMPRMQWTFSNVTPTWTMTFGKRLQFPMKAGNWVKFSKLDSMTRWTMAFPADRKAGWLGIGILHRWMVIDSIKKVPEEFERPFLEVPEVAVVAPLGPAATAGVEPGDTLIAIDGLSLLTAAGAEKFRRPTIGTSLTLTLRRAGVQRDVKIVASPVPPGPPSQ